MAGTKAGGLKAAQTNKEKYGKEFYARIGAIGGKKTGIKGFALARTYALDDPRHPANAGRKGGLRSKRGKAIK